MDLSAGLAYLEKKNSEGDKKMMKKLCDMKDDSIDALKVADPKSSAVLPIILIRNIQNVMRDELRGHREILIHILSRLFINNNLPQPAPHFQPPPPSGSVFCSYQPPFVPFGGPPSNVPPPAPMPIPSTSGMFGPQPEKPSKKRPRKPPKEEDREMVAEEKKPPVKKRKKANDMPIVAD